MLFNSFDFVLLVTVSFALYYTPALRRLQVALLIAASFTFYAANSLPLLALLVGSIFINITTSWAVARSSLRAARAWAMVGLAANLAVLGFFKYAGLLYRTVSDIVQAESAGHVLLMIPLPIGISFFTFQGMSLVADTFRMRDTDELRDMVHASAPKHGLHTALFISFFPQLVAGPIVKAHQFMPQIKPKTLADVDWALCYRCLVLGYFLKMVIADNLKDLTFWIAYPHFVTRSSAELVAMLFGYSMQIFADFAGYSLIAIGVAWLFGYRLPQNFNFPYIARSFADFWRRWHISLSTWLRDYLYFPLGGNRRGARRTYFNLFVVMFLGGLWHGAAWSYAVWGTAHGLCLAGERLLRRWVKLPDHLLVRIVQGAAVFTVVTGAWLLFKLPRFEHAVQYVRSIGANGSLPTDVSAVMMITLFSLPIVLYHAASLMEQGRPASALQAAQGPALGVMLFLIATNAGSPGAFIYFQF